MSNEPTPEPEDENSTPMDYMKFLVGAALFLAVLCNLIVYIGITSYALIKKFAVWMEVAL